MSSSSETLISKSSSIRDEIKQIRGHLFDMDDANYSLAKIMEKIQQLTEAENAVVESQRDEIVSLREQLRNSDAEKRDAISTLEMIQQLSEAENAVVESQRNEIMHLRAQLQKSAPVVGAEAKNSIGEIHHNDLDVCQVRTEIQELEASKARINDEIDTLKDQIKILSSERTDLIKEVEVFGHLNELACELEEERNARQQLEKQLKEIRDELKKVLAEKEEAMERAETEAIIREELEKEIKELYEDKLTQEKQPLIESDVPSVSNSLYERDILKLKKEIALIRAENKSLRVTAKRETSRKRALASSQSTAGDDEKSREYKRSIGYEPRERLNSGSSDNSYSHESDNVSVLFGQDSISGKISENPASIKSSDDSRSDHKGIRAHAERLLFWANKAAERQKHSSTHSVASGSVLSRQHPVPATIGLPPRGQSRVNRKPGLVPPGLLPPRPPQSHHDDSDMSGSVGDKENGTAFNVVIKEKSKKSTASKQGVIFNMEKVKAAQSCQCYTSPFSGNDPHADFYLPKLGLACTCGQSSILEDRDSFSKHPTSLKNILRPWQCDFLRSIGVETADQLLRVHKSGANDMARKLKKWREENNMAPARSKECYVALQIWSRTAKVVLRSITKQREAGEEVIEKPSFLDISIGDTHSVSTLGHGSIVGGRTPFEMGEI